MDQWTEANWPGRTHPPVLRAVAGRSLRVLPRPDIPYDPDSLALAPDTIRVLVISDDLLARRGVLAALDDQAGMVVVGDRGPGPGLAAAILSTNPDVVLLHGLTAEDARPTLAAVHQDGGTARVLAIGARSDLSTMDTHGQLPASATPEQVAAAVRMAAAGYVLHPGPSAPPPPAAPDPLDAKEFAHAAGLTERECEVLTLVARGLSNAEIAAELTVSEHTVKSHVQNLLGKLKLRNRIHAVIFAFDTGLASPGTRS